MTAMDGAAGATPADPVPPRRGSKRRKKSSAVERWLAAKELGFPDLKGNGIPRYGLGHDSPQTSASRLVTIGVRGLLDAGADLVRARTLIELLDAVVLHEGRLNIPALTVRRQGPAPWAIQIVDEKGLRKATGFFCDDGKTPEHYPGAMMRYWLKREEQLHKVMERTAWQDIDVGHVINQLLLDHEPGKGSHPIAFESWAKKVNAAEHLQPFFNGTRLGDLLPNAGLWYCRQKTSEFIRSQKEDNPKRRLTSLLSAQGHVAVLQQAANRVLSAARVAPICFEMEKIPDEGERWLTPDQFLRLLWATFGLIWDPDKNDWKKEMRTTAEGVKKPHFILAPLRQRRQLRMMRRFLLIYTLTGTRYDVLLKLLWGSILGQPCIDPDGGTIYRAGSGGDRPGQKPRDESPIIGMLLRWIRVWYAADRKRKRIAVIQQANGKAYAGGSIWRWVDLLGKNAGVPWYRAHVAKHSGMTFLNKHGLSPKMISVFFGTDAVTLLRTYDKKDSFVHAAAVEAAEAAGLTSLSKLRPKMPVSAEKFLGPRE